MHCGMIACRRTSHGDARPCELVRPPAGRYNRRKFAEAEMSRGLTWAPLLLLVSFTAAPVARAQDAQGVAPPPPVSPSVPAKMPAKPLPAVSHMIVISADGCRPDVLLRAHTPNVRHMMEAGTFTMWARTVPQSITLPSHTSMLTGVTPERHKVLWNADLPEPIYPKVPTIFDVAKAGGLTTAMVTGKTKFVSLGRPGAVDWEKVQVATDEEVGSRAASLLREHKPNLMFVHLPGADVAGHSKGWGTPEQVEAIEAIDRAVGVLLGAVADAKLADSTVVLFTADHGGAGRSHGPNDPRSRHIPWVLTGPGIRQGYDLTRDAALTVNTEDTFATTCWFLGLRPPQPIDGKPIEEVLADRELLRTAK